MKKNTCETCAYRGNIPGDTHICCQYKWESVSVMPKGDPHGIRHGWYSFPFRFDPIWMLELCSQWADVVDPEHRLEANPLFTIMSLLRR